MQGEEGEETRMGKLQGRDPAGDKTVDISRFIIKGRKFYFYTRWREESFSVVVTEGRSVWFEEGPFSLSLVAGVLWPHAPPLDTWTQQPESSSTES